MKTRFAPTPSGFLHLGNLLSFLVSQAFAQKMGAKVLLRIDDLDQQRTRDAYILDILDTLRFFNLSWDEGPLTVEIFKTHYSQIHRKELYDAALDFLQEQDALYACNCSRSKLNTIAICDCLNKELSLHQDHTCWRLKQRVTEKIVINDIDGKQSHYVYPEYMQHLVVRKKDGNASYQLASVIDDIHFGVNLIVRGKDLMDSTIAQIFLSTLLPQNNFAHSLFHHHPLLFELDGRKMSKSEGSTSLVQLRKNKMGADEILRQLSVMIGMNPLPKSKEEFSQFLTNQWIEDIASASS